MKKLTPEQIAEVFRVIGGKCRIIIPKTPTCLYLDVEGVDEEVKLEWGYDSRMIRQHWKCYAEDLVPDDRTGSDAFVEHGIASGEDFNAVVKEVGEWLDEWAERRKSLAQQKATTDADIPF